MKIFNKFSVFILTFLILLFLYSTPSIAQCYNGIPPNPGCSGSSEAGSCGNSGPNSCYCLASCGNGWFDTSCPDCISKTVTCSCGNPTTCYKPKPPPKCTRNKCTIRGCTQFRCQTVEYDPPCNQANDCANGGDLDCKTCGGPTSPPAPTATSIPPPPTATTIPPSPTPIPPTAVVTAPPAQDLSQKAGTPSKPTQAWMCLDTEFCYKSANCSKIAGVDYVHRVRLKNKADVKLQSSTRTYIFECLQTDAGYRCTSGNSAVDNEVIGTNYLDTMLSEHGYSFIKLTAADGSTSIGQPLTTGAGGELGPYEWESTTIKNIGRVFFAVQNIVGSNALDAEGSLHQGTVTFEGKGGQKCLLIKYDPHGIVIDQTTKQLITNASVTLLQKNKQGNFETVTSKNLIGGIINPASTDKNGSFAFMVPGGIYQIKVEKSGYRPYLSPEITQKDKSEYLEVILQRLSLIEKMSKFISDLHF